MRHSSSIFLSCRASQVFIFFHSGATWNLVTKAKGKGNECSMPPTLERRNYPSPGEMRHIAALPLARPATGSPLPLSRARAHWRGVNGRGKGLKISYQIFSCLPTSLESQGSSWWLRHRRNKTRFRGSLKRWGRSSTLRAHPGTPLLPPPPPPSLREEGAHRCFPDPRLVCPREGAALALPFPTYPAGRRPGALTWFASPLERSLQKTPPVAKHRIVSESEGEGNVCIELSSSVYRGLSTAPSCAAPHRRPFLIESSVLTTEEDTKWRPKFLAHGTREGTLKTGRASLGI